MLPRTLRNPLIALLVMSAGCAPLILGSVRAGAVSAVSAVNPARIADQPDVSVRYHFGDDPGGKLRWADPDFDDSSWPAVQTGIWPLPAFYSDGFMWVRARIPVRSDASGQLAIRTSQKADLTDSFVVSDEVFVNGRLVGHRGSLPPHPNLVLAGRDAVFDLNPGLVQPGKTALVAFRVWYPLILRAPETGGSEQFAIDEARVLRLATRADYLATVMAGGPDLVLNSLIASLGIGLLILWRFAGGRELLLCSAMLISFPLFDALNGMEDLGLVTWPWGVDSVMWPALRITTMAVMIEFVWATHGLRILGLKRLAQIAMVVRNISAPIVRLAAAPSPIIYWSGVVRLPAGGIVDLVVLGVNLWMLVTRKSNRLISAALALIPFSSLMQKFFGLADGTVGQFHFDYFNLAYFIAALALFVTLVQRAWLAWRTRDELRVEFDTAREMQQRLVAPAKDVPGFRIESAYEPAKQVGGDFFRVVPEEGGSLLVVVGDVSGKGLPAAMTVSAVVGALRSTPPVSPAWILNALNHGLAGQMQGGFVTCCAARIHADGMVTIANAGHLSPYRGGAEVQLEAGIPLGIVPAVEYKETEFLLQPSESLTFLSDGVVEARNNAGELFGFERTLRISNAGAAAIACAAKEFGQDDDITVLSITRTSGLEPAIV
jgi:hypothetical protein